MDARNRSLTDVPKYDIKHQNFEFVLFNKNNPFTEKCKVIKKALLDNLKQRIQQAIAETRNFEYTDFGLAKGAKRFVYNVVDFKYEVESQYQWSVYFHQRGGELQPQDLKSAIDIIRKMLQVFLEKKIEVNVVTNL